METGFWIEGGDSPPASTPWRGRYLLVHGLTGLLPIALLAATLEAWPQLQASLRAKAPAHDPEHLLGALSR
jgi:hypothetical protein